MNKGAKMVCDALLMRDFVTVVVAGKPYTVKPPTIRVIAGAAGCLSCLGNEESFSDILRSLSDMGKASEALSWFIAGDDTMKDELSEGTVEEVTDALEACFSLVSVEGFTKLSILARNVAELAARRK